MGSRHAPGWGQGNRLNDHFSKATADTGHGSWAVSAAAFQFFTTTARSARRWEKYRRSRRSHLEIRLRALRGFVVKIHGISSDPASPSTRRDPFNQLA
jgi:hypothetical protein